MFLTAYNILGATEDVKKDFVATFSAQTMEVDKKLGKLFTIGDVEFGTAFITLIRLALSHANDNTAILNRQLEDIINPLSPHVTTNPSSPTFSSSFPSPVPNIEPNVNIPNPVMSNNPKLKSPKWITPTKINSSHRKLRSRQNA